MLTDISVASKVCLFCQRTDFIELLSPTFLSLALPGFQGVSLSGGSQETQCAPSISVDGGASISWWLLLSRGGSTGCMPRLSPCSAEPLCLCLLLVVGTASIQDRLWVHPCQTSHQQQLHCQSSNCLGTQDNFAQSSWSED